MSVQRDLIRREARFPGKVQVLVSCETWSGFVRLWTRNVSAGGLFLSCDVQSCPSLGASVAVKMGAQALAGRVAHVRSSSAEHVASSDAGFGVAFLDRHPLWWTLTGFSDSVQFTITDSMPEAHHRAAQSLYAAGVRYLGVENYDAAKKKFSHAFKANQDLQYLAMQVVCGGYQYLCTGLWEDARESFLRALEIAPSCREASIALEKLARTKLGS